jgi:hypothetical protein
MSHNNGEMINFGEQFILDFEESPPNDDEGGVGGLNCIPRLVKPLVIMSFVP